MHPQWTQLEFTANFGDTEVRKTGGCGHKYVPGMMLGVVGEGGSELERGVVDMWLPVVWSGRE